MSKSNYKNACPERVGVAFAALTLLLGACSDIKPMSYREISDIQAGPGLLSGEDGAFTFTIE